MISASARRLSVFKAVVEEGGFNRAAMRLDISQPSVGAHVKALEQQAGHALFERKRGARPELTKAGEAVYAMALEVLRRGEEAAQQLDELRPAHDLLVSLAVHRDGFQHGRFLKGVLRSLGGSFNRLCGENQTGWAAYRSRRPTCTSAIFMISKMIATDQPISRRPFSAVIGPIRRQPSTATTSP